MEMSKEVMAGQQLYNKLTLTIYDFILYTLSTGLIWRCPTEKLLDLYNKNISNNHLDVGVGTGFLLDKCKFPTTKPRLALMDLNQASLDFTAKRLVRYQPYKYQRNILADIKFNDRRFDSIGLNYLLHCIPGSLTEKAIAFDHLFQLLNPGGVMFGTTLLTSGVKRNTCAKGLMKIYNHKGIFCNNQDSLVSLQTSLSQRFDNFSIDVVGCAAQFVIKKSSLTT